VEITGDPMMIAPVGIATLIAVVVGNHFNHGLYHSLIDIASFPFLPDRWPKQMPTALRVEHILKEGDTVVCMPLMAQRPELTVILQDHEYTGFPVLDDNHVVVGFAFRKHLQQLMDEMTDTVDIGRVTDFDYVTIRASLPLEVAFNLFKRMEVSHLIVSDNNHHPMAVLTRGSLLPWQVEETIGHRRMHHVRSTIQRPRQFRREHQQSARFDTFFTEATMPEAESGNAIPAPSGTPTNASVGASTGRSSVGQWGAQSVGTDRHTMGGQSLDELGPSRLGHDRSELLSSSIYPSVLMPGKDKQSLVFSY